MPNPDTLETVIFDFDGTIADTIEEARIVVNELAAEYHFKEIAAEDVDALRNLNLSQLMKELGISKLHLPILLAKGTKLLKSRIKHVVPIAGMHEVVKMVRQKAKTVGILTSNSQENVELFLEKYQLSNCFDFIRSSSKLTSKAKSLRKIMKAVDCTVADTVYIGDEVRDIEACKKVGLPVIAVSWGFNAREVLLAHEPEVLVDSAADLAEALQQFLVTK